MSWDAFQDILVYVILPGVLMGLLIVVYYGN